MLKAADLAKETPPEELQQIWKAKENELTNTIRWQETRIEYLIEEKKRLEDNERAMKLKEKILRRERDEEKTNSISLEKKITALEKVLDEALAQVANQRTSIHRAQTLLRSIGDLTTVSIGG